MNILIVFLPVIILVICILIVFGIDWDLSSDLIKEAYKIKNNKGADN